MAPRYFHTHLGRSFRNQIDHNRCWSAVWSVRLIISVSRTSSLRPSPQHWCQPYGLTLPASSCSCHGRQPLRPAVLGRSFRWRAPRDCSKIFHPHVAYGTVTPCSHCSICAIRSDHRAPCATGWLRKGRLTCARSFNLPPPSFGCAHPI